jgi:hypothetical protein
MNIDMETRNSKKLHKKGEYDDTTIIENVQANRYVQRILAKLKSGVGKGHFSIASPLTAAQ